LVEVLSVSAPYLIIPGLKMPNEKRKVCLQDFGPVPFILPIPCNMLRRKEDGSYTFTTPRRSVHSIVAGSENEILNVASRSTSSDTTSDNGIDASETADVLANLPIAKGPHKLKEVRGMNLIRHT